MKNIEDLTITELVQDCQKLIHQQNQLPMVAKVNINELTVRQITDFVRILEHVRYCDNPNNEH